MTVISSICYSDQDALLGILSLHVGDNRFDLDPTYSRGIIHRGLLLPKYRFDLSPQIGGCAQADCRSLPLAKASIHSIVFDPPFMFGQHGKTGEYKMTKRFTMFDTFTALEDLYRGSLSEFWRVLNRNGVLVFKCQDYTDSKTTMTHVLVYNWAMEHGFYAKDLFVLVSKARIYNPLLKQRHARKFHSYYWVFQKKEG